MQLIEQDLGPGDHIFVRRNGMANVSQFKKRSTGEIEWD